MKVITVNVVRGDLSRIRALVGDHGIYPSRSELVRVAIREFLIRELKFLKREIIYEPIKESAKPGTIQWLRETYPDTYAKIEQNGVRRNGV